MSSLQIYNRFLQSIYKNTTRSISFLSKKEEKQPVETEETSSEVLPILADDENVEEREAEIEQKRNISRLLPQHRNMLNEKIPYNNSQSWIHETVKYKRMMFGRYGLASGIDPSICFPSNPEKAETIEYERVAFPHTLPEMIQINQQMKAEKAERIQIREAQIAKKFEKLEQWKHELHSKVAKRESDAKAAKDRKDRIVEEVRRHFGYKVDPRDEKFKEMLEMKEKEDKKKMREEKKKAKENKMIEKIITKNDSKATKSTAADEKIEST